MSAFSDIDYSYLGVPGLTGDRPVRVTNLGRQRVYYTLPELNGLHRTFQPVERGIADTKVVTFHELYTLNNSPGGPQLIFDNLQIKDNDVRKALDLPEDPEFDYSVEEIKELIEKGTEDEILDALEFGPYYLAQWMKEVIITEGLNDFEKRKFFEGLFNFNLTAAQENFNWSKEDPIVGSIYQAMDPNTKERERRASSPSEPKPRERRVRRAK